MRGSTELAQPVSVYCDTHGTGKISDDAISCWIAEQFDLRPAAIIDYLNLRRPIYAATAAYGHFGREDGDFPWEKINEPAAKALATLAE